MDMKIIFSWAGIFAAIILYDVAILGQINRFTEIGANTLTPVVIDANTGLMWQSWRPIDQSEGNSEDFQNSNNKLNWMQALALCATLSWGEHNGWRLPSVLELSSIVDDRKASILDPPNDSPAISNVFPQTMDAGYWTSTSHAGLNQHDQAWYVNFQHGNVEPTGKKELLYVRCVRKADIE